MKSDELAALLKRNPSLAARNRAISGAAGSAKPEQVVRDESYAAVPRAKGKSPSYRICVTSFRKRLCDPDNLCPKYYIDGLRLIGLIPDDTAQDIELVVRQEKSKTEYTEILITML